MGGGGGANNRMNYSLFVNITGGTSRWGRGANNWM